VSPIRTRREAGSHQGAKSPTSPAACGARASDLSGAGDGHHDLCRLQCDLRLRRWLKEWPGVDSSTPAHVAHWTHLRLPYVSVLNTFRMLLAARHGDGTAPGHKARRTRPYRTPPGISLAENGIFPGCGDDWAGCALLQDSAGMAPDAAAGFIWRRAECYVRLPGDHFARHPRRGWIAGTTRCGRSSRCRSSWIHGGLRWMWRPGIGTSWWVWVYLSAGRPHEL